MKIADIDKKLGRQFLQQYFLLQRRDCSAFEYLVLRFVDERKALRVYEAIDGDALVKQLGEYSKGGGHRG